MEIKTDIIILMQKHFESVKVARPWYSMRALSRDCGINTTCMNRLMNRKKKLTPLYAILISEFLELGLSETLHHVRVSLGEDEESTSDVATTENQEEYLNAYVPTF